MLHTWNAKFEIIIRKTNTPEEQWYKISTKQTIDIYNEMELMSSEKEQEERKKDNVREMNQASTKAHRKYNIHQQKKNKTSHTNLSPGPLTGAAEGFSSQQTKCVTQSYDALSATAVYPSSALSLSCVGTYIQCMFRKLYIN